MRIVKPEWMLRKLFNDKSRYIRGDYGWRLIGPKVFEPFFDDDMFSECLKKVEPVKRKSIYNYISNRCGYGYIEEWTMPVIDCYEFLKGEEND